MFINRREMKSSAKESMRNTRPSPILVTLVYILLTTGVNGIILGAVVLRVGPGEVYYWLSEGYALSEILYGSLGSVGSTLFVFANILFALYSVIMAFGYTSYTLNVARNQESGYGMLLDGFSLAGRVLLLTFLEGLFVFLWSLLFIIPGIVAAYRYRMAYYVLLDDPDCGALEAIRRSKAMMADHKAELLIFDLSFINWYLLLVAAFLISYIIVSVTGLPDFVSDAVTYLLGLLLSLWMKPFIHCTTANFYAAIGGGRQTEEPPLWSSGPDGRF